MTDFKEYDVDDWYSDLQVIQPPMFTAGERGLLYELLFRTFSDLYLPEFRESAASWIGDTETTEDDVWSYLWVCSQLDMNVGIWKKRGADLIARTSQGLTYKDRYENAISIAYTNAHKNELRRANNPRKPGRPKCCWKRAAELDDAA